MLGLLIQLLADKILSYYLLFLGGRRGFCKNAVILKVVILKKELVIVECFGRRRDGYSVSDYFSS